MTEREIAAESGYSAGMVHRKLKQGRSPIEIIAEGKQRDTSPKCKTVPATSKQSVSKSGKQPKQKPIEVLPAITDGPDTPEADEDFFGAQRRKEIALADLRELELAQKRSELVPSVEVETQWATICTTIRDSMLSLPSKLADKLAAMTNEREIAAFLRNELRSELTRISKSLDESPPTD